MPRKDEKIMTNECKTSKRSRRGQCFYCGKPEQNIPPGHSNRICSDCWVTETEDGKVWAIEQQCLNETPEETAQFLRGAGYDLDALDERIQKVVRKASDESPMNPKNQTDATLDNPSDDLL